MRFNPCKKMTTDHDHGPQDHVTTSPESPLVSSPVVPLSVAIKATTHTKRQCPIWIAQIAQRVERKEFLRLLGVAKSHGGYWSSFGPLEMHGFIFFDVNKAAAFAANAGPQTTRPQDHTDRPQDHGPQDQKTPGSPVVSSPVVSLSGLSSPADDCTNLIADQDCLERGLPEFAQCASCRKFAQEPPTNIIQFKAA